MQVLHKLIQHHVRPHQLFPLHLGVVDCLLNPMLRLGLRAKHQVQLHHHGRFRQLVMQPHLLLHVPQIKSFPLLDVSLLFARPHARVQMLAVTLRESHQQIHERSDSR